MRGVTASRSLSCIRRLRYIGYVLCAMREIFGASCDRDRAEAGHQAAP